MSEKIYCVCAKWQQYERPTGFTVKFFSSKKEAEHYVEEQQKYYKCECECDTESGSEDFDCDCSDEIYYRYEICPVEVDREIEFYDY